MAKVPEPVRRDKIPHTIHADGRSVISLVEQSDLPLGRFLCFLEQDIEKNPDRIQNTRRKINPDLVSRSQSLISGIEVDLESPLFDADEINI